MAHRIWGALLVFALIVTLLISDRDWMLGSRETVDDVTELPKAGGTLLSNLESIVDDYGVHTIHAPIKAEIIYNALTGRRRFASWFTRSTQPPRYGYSVIEYSLFAMPFGWSTENGFALYTDDRHELVVAKLVEPAEAELRKELKRDPREGFIFPFWAHLWGWAFVAAFGVWGWLYYRAIVRRRAELGLI